MERGADVQHLLGCGIGRKLHRTLRWLFCCAASYAAGCSAGAAGAAAVRRQPEQRKDHRQAGNLPDLTATLS